MQKIKNRIRQIRKEKKLTISEMCRHLNVSRNTYYGYETGNPIPSDKLLILSDLFGKVCIDYMLCRTDENGVYQVNVIGVCRDRSKSIELIEADQPR